MAVCSQCSQEKARDAFSKAQLRKTDATRRCKQCIEAEGCQEASSNSARQKKAALQKKKNQEEKSKWLEKNDASDKHKRASLYQPPAAPPDPIPLPEDTKTKVMQLIARAVSAIMGRGVPTGFGMDGYGNQELAARLWEICNNKYMSWLTVPLMIGLVGGEAKINRKVAKNPGEEPFTILMWACQHKFFKQMYNYCGGDGMIALVLAAGADVTVRLSNGCNALFFAVKYTSAQAVELLLDAGVKVDDRDCFGHTIWKNAVERPDLGIIDVLLNRCNKIIPVEKEIIPIGEDKSLSLTVPYTLPDNMLITYASLIHFTDNPTNIPISWQVVGAPKMDDLATALVRILQAGAQFSQVNAAAINTTDPLAEVTHIDAPGVLDCSEPQLNMTRLLRDVIYGRRLPETITKEVQSVSRSCSPNDTCPICLSEMEPSDNPVTLYCGHQYCLECIKAYGKANLDRGLTHRLESISIGQDGQLIRNMRAEGTDKRCPICRRLLCGDLLDQDYNQMYRSLVGLRLGIDHHEAGGETNSLTHRGPHLLSDAQLRFECKVIIGKSEGTRESLLEELLRSMKESTYAGSEVKIGDETYPVNEDGVQVELSASVRYHIRKEKLILHPPQWGPVVIPIQVKGVPVLASLSPHSIFTVVPKAVVTTFGLKTKPITSSRFIDALDKKIYVAEVVDEIKFFLQDVEICLNNAIVLNNESGIMNIQLGKDFFETAMWTRWSVRLADDVYVVSDGGYTTNMIMNDQSDELRYYSRGGKICQVPLIHIRNYSGVVEAPKIIRLPNFSNKCGECQWCCRYFPCDGMLKYDDNDGDSSSREFRYYCDEECKAKGLATRSVS